MSITHVVTFIAAAETLAAEVAHLNIKVLNVLPGALRTLNWDNVIYQSTSPNALLPPLYIQDGLQSQSVQSSPGTLEEGKKTDSQVEGRIADYAVLREKMMKWMNDVVNEGDADKSAEVIIDVVSNEGASMINKDGKARGWPELDMLVLGRDAEANIRDKCNAILKNLDEWQDVAKGILRDDLQKS